MTGHGRCHGLCIAVGPLTGLSGVADELLLHLGYQPAEQPAVRAAIETAIGGELLDLGRAILAEHGLPVRDLPIGDPA